jgi:hypothetical protein
MRTPLPGDFGLTKINGYAGAMIRVGQWLNGNGFSQDEHAFIVLPGEHLVEAEPGGARIGNLTEYPDELTTYSSWDLDPIQRQAIVATATALLGTPYSTLDYLALAAHRLHIPAPGLRRYIASSKHVICSQLVDLCYQSAGIQLFKDGRWPGYVTPGALRQALVSEVAE